ncbi:Nicotinamide riboside kinase [Desulfuromusa kysingii]|uniref:Nicotinamide riboside kinase n=1 Tax=Desulfuromusa kysingii TaxID=37625 RepID=A0A1H4DHX7_9BACT|nr:ATP-binding protein [Desulfuromusa kysingii]SEA72040.1 Nicotinamide riboside kinase [Desulfuromusa kysingii]
MLRIVITGAESSGKSSLTHYLGVTLKIPYAMEYARYYLEKHGPEYDLELLTRMSLLHLDYQQHEVPVTAPLGIFDTDLLNYKIWAEEVFGCCPIAINNAINAESTHRYLLCKPDLPWEPDPLRENPSDCQRIYLRHRNEIIRLQRPYEEVEGFGQERNINAEAALQRLLKKS